MRILVITRTAWRKDNSLGNTYSNLFGNLKDVEIGNIYLGDGFPDADNSNVISYYCISEKEIVKNLLNGKKIGKRIGKREIDCAAEKNNEKGSHILEKIKKNRCSLFYLLREAVWKFGHPNLDDMMNYIRDFKPDLIFLSFYYAAYVDRIALYIKHRLDVPLVLEAAVDIYSLKQLSFDPFYWINRFYIRRMVRKTVNKAEKLYVISEKMQMDYEKMLGIPCSVLYKFPDITRKLYKYKEHDGDLNFLYTGNIGSGRWKTLGLIGSAVKENGLGTLRIYTPTPLNQKMKEVLSDCAVLAPISSNEVILEQNRADVLVHVESFNIADKLEVRYSISTKIMDYISVARCILAVGPSDIASMQYLSKRGLAFLCYNRGAIDDMVRKLGDNRVMIKAQADHNEHYIDMIKNDNSQIKFRDDMQRIVAEFNGKKINA